MDYGKLNLLGLGLALLLREIIEDLGASRFSARVTFVVSWAAWLLCVAFIRRKRGGK